MSHYLPWFKDLDVVLLGLSNTKFDRRRLIDTRGFWIVKCEAKWWSGKSPKGKPNVKARVQPETQGKDKQEGSKGNSKGKVTR